MASLNRLDALVPVVEDLGRRHAGYGVKDEHYDSVGAALLWTLERGLGKAWTPQVAEASATCGVDRKSTRLNSSHSQQSRMPSSA